MNPIIQSLFDRKSVRAFQRREVDEPARSLILSAAAQAPTAGNQQLYTILDIRSQALKDALAESCDHQPFIATAPMVLIFCADCKKWDDAYRSIGLTPRSPGAGDLLLAVEDALIAAQNAVVAAESLGLGSCYIGDILEHREYHKELLHLPDHVLPIAMLVLGWPTETARRRRKPQRAPMEHIVHTDGYRAMDDRELRSMLIHNAGEQPYEEWLTAFCARKFDSDFSREMTRSAEGYLAEYLPRGE